MLIPYGVTGITGVTGMTGFTGNATMAEYHAAAKMDATCHIRLRFIEQGITFTESDIESAGVDYDMILNGDDDLVFGNAVMAEFKTCLFMSGQTTQLVWENEFAFDIGMDVDEERTVWTQIGLFTGTRPDRVNSMGLIDFVACDRMQKFDILADDWIDSLSYPMTLRQMYNSLCTYVGVENEAGDELTGIMNRTYNEAPVIAHGLLCRDILGMMAEAAGCYARITQDGKVRMVWFHDHTGTYELEEKDEFSCQSLGIHFANTSTTWEDLEDDTWESLENTAWSDLEYYQQQLKIVAVSVKQTEEDIGYMWWDKTEYPTEPPEGNVYLIVDNPYLVIFQDDEVQDYIKPIYDRLAAFGGYLPMNVDCVGNPLIQPGDMINVAIHDDVVRMPIFYKSMNVTMGCVDKYEATGNVKRAEVPTSVRQELKDGGKRHIFRNDINELYSEIFDSNNMSRITQNAHGIQQLVERKAAIYYGPLGSTGITGVTGYDFHDGDIWIVTDDNNRMLRYNGSSWNDASFDDTSKARIFKSSTAPTGTTSDPLQDGDIWIDTYNNAQTGVSHNYKMYTYDLANATWREVSPDKYTIRSGIDIKAEGVEVTGGKYVKIKSGGVFDVDSTNFKLSSTDKKLKTGNWTINDNGLLFEYTKQLYGGGTQQGQFTLGTSKRTDKPCNVGIVVDSPDSIFGDVNYATVLTLYGKVGDWVMNSLDFQFSQRLAHEQGYLALQIWPNGETHLGGSMPFAPPFTSGTFEVVKADTYNGPSVVGSSREYKHDIEEIHDSGETIDKLRPISFVYNKDMHKGDRTHFGLIYEEVIDVIPELCVIFDDKQGYTEKTICYTELIPILLKEVQELRKRVATLEEKVNELERK